MNQETIITALGCLSGLAGNLKGNDECGTVSGNEVIMIKVGSLSAAADTILLCVATLTKEIFGQAAPTDDTSCSIPRPAPTPETPH